MRSEDIPAKIDERANNLLEHFKQHLATFQEEMKRDHPEHLEPNGSLDAHRVFEGWVIQKIANIEILIEYQDGLISELIRRIRIV